MIFGTFVLLCGNRFQLVFLDDPGTSAADARSIYCVDACIAKAISILCHQMLIFPQEFQYFWGRYPAGENLIQIMPTNMRDLKIALHVQR